ncbi:MAG TPA: iron-sulfur cluster assembly scaffold protein [candidate division Zixibacteria bacterium]|nr:iron-sulfur cluster assembly scaffold protein [candidate division Zixibacteria bacterium]
MTDGEFAYNAAVMDHFQNPRNAGEIDNPDAHVETKNPNCGDAIALDIVVSGETLADAKFLTFGCGAAIATCSKATEMVIGRSLEEVERLTGADIIAALGGLPAHKHACANLAPEALRLAIRQYRESRS